LDKSAKKIEFFKNNENLVTVVDTRQKIELESDRWNDLEVIEYNVCFNKGSRTYGSA
jgi:hypothetical protein